MRLSPAPLYHEVADGPEGGVAHWAETSDGVRIRLAHWVHEGAKGTVLLFPGRTEYIEKYGRAASDLRARGFATMIIDWRGQGIADRLTEDRAVGHVGEFGDYQRDVAAMVDAAQALDLPKPFFLLAHSMGGCIGLRALMGGLPVKAAAFSGPMWGIQMSAAMRPTAWALSWVGRKAGAGTSFTPGTKALTYVLDADFECNNLTHDRDMWEYMQVQMRERPDLALGGPGLHWLHEAMNETRALAKLPAPDYPCITFLGGDEKIVDTPAIHKRMENWPGGELHIVKGGEHEVLMELPEMRTPVYDGICAFFDRHL
ncbi:alpha/beta fold hydrolase [Shimia biformata]|uniref:alpha/beta fold hydrolase n=1 Tax=Shimia biformata TaxID=1294299 RepID=UPI001950B553|nr:alpha/beta hydrolase [Shimia biformata]